MKKSELNYTTHKFALSEKRSKCENQKHNVEWVQPIDIANHKELSRSSIMAIQDYTDFLGKQVKFIVHDEYFNTRTSSNILIRKITGTVMAVALYENLHESEFLIKETDEYYRFSEAIFFKELPNPSRLERVEP